MWNPVSDPPYESRTLGISVSPVSALISGQSFSLVKFRLTETSSDKSACLKRNKEKAKKKKKSKLQP